MWNLFWMFSDSADFPRWKEKKVKEFTFRMKNERLNLAIVSVGVIIVLILGITDIKPGAAASANKSLVIALDGVRADALLQANTPNIEGLINNTWSASYKTAYSFSAQTIFDADPWSGPNHASIMTSVTSAKHQVTGNDNVGLGNYATWPHYLKRLETANPSLNTAYLVSWATDLQIPSNADYIKQETDAANTARVVNILNGTFSDTSWAAGTDPDAMFLFLDEPDHAGHAYGFSPAIANYITALQTVDGQIGQILTALKARPNFSNENWQIIITSDHGGSPDLNHGYPRADNWTIPFIVTSKTVQAGELAGTASNVDTAITALAHMGLTTTGLGLDGVVRGASVLPANTNALLDGLVVNLRLDNNYADSSGHGNNASGVGAPLLRSIGGKFGGYATLNTTTGPQYISLGTPADLNFGTTTDFSVSLWFRASAAQAGDPVIIGNKNWGSGANKGWTLTYVDATNMGLNLASSSADRKDLKQLTNTTNEWWFLAGTVDRDGNAVFYAGTPGGVMYRISGNASLVGDLTSTLPTNIGQDGTGAYSPNLVGDIDDLGIWRRSLTTDEILYLYNNGTGRQIPTSAPTPTPDPNYNYVQNPGFESGSFFDWGQWNDMSVVNNNQRSGSYALRAGNSPASSEQTISNLSPNTLYTLTGWAKLASGSTGGVYLGVKSYGGPETQVNVATTTYSPATISFATGAFNTSATIYCYRYSGSGYAYCDDFNLISLGSAPATPTPLPTSTPMGNYVLNAGFETGSLSPWGAWNNSVVNSDAHSGAYAMQIGSSTGSGEQTISGLSANTAYVLTGWVKTSSSSVTAQAGVKNYGGSETYQASTNTNYTQLSINFTTGVNNTTAQIYCYKPTSNGYVYCDDFQLAVTNGAPTATPTLTPTYTVTPTNTPTPANSGWVNPGANAAGTGGDGNGIESNPSNGYTDNALFGTDTNSGTNTNTSCSNTGKDRHIFYGYGLSFIPAGSTILGLEVQLQAKVDSTSGSPKSCVELSWDGGTTWTLAKASDLFTTTEAGYILGGSADIWGRAWNATELGNLQVRITNVASNTSRDFSLDWVAVRVTYK